MPRAVGSAQPGTTLVDLHHATANLIRRFPDRHTVTIFESENTGPFDMIYDAMGAVWYAKPGYIQVLAAREQAYRIVRQGLAPERKWLGEEGPWSRT